MPINWAAINTAAANPLPYVKRYGQGIGNNDEFGDTYYLDYLGRKGLGDPSTFLKPFNDAGYKWLAVADRMGNPWLIPVTDAAGNHLYEWSKLHAPNSGDPGDWNSLAKAAYQDAEAKNLKSQKIAAGDGKRLLWIYPVNDHSIENRMRVWHQDPLDMWGANNPKAQVPNPRGEQAKSMVWYHAADGSRNIYTYGEVPDYNGGSGAWTDDLEHSSVDASTISEIMFEVELPVMSKEGKVSHQSFKAVGNRFLRIAYLVDIERSAVPGWLELVEDIITTIKDVALIVVGAVAVNPGMIVGAAVDLVRTWVTYGINFDSGEKQADQWGKLADKSAKGKPKGQQMSAFRDPNLALLTSAVVTHDGEQPTAHPTAALSADVLASNADTLRQLREANKPAPKANDTGSLILAAIAAYWWLV